MIRLLALLVVVCALTPIASADDDAFHLAMTRLPEQAAPAPAFSNIPQSDMGVLCASLSGRERYYPERALRQNLTGSAALDCVIGADGRPQTCQVLYEEPEGFGFGAASVRIACHFRVDVASLETHEIVGNLPGGAYVYRPNGEGEPWRMRVPVRFRLR